MKAQDYNVEIWATHNLPLRNVLNANHPFINGFVLEAEYKYNNEVYTRKATKINSKIISIDTSEYKNMMNF